MEARKSAKKTGCAGNGLKCVFMLCADSSHIPFKKEVRCERMWKERGSGGEVTWIAGKEPWMVAEEGGEFGG